MSILLYFHWYNNEVELVTVTKKATDSPVHFVIELVGWVVIFGGVLTVIVAAFDVTLPQVFCIVQV